MPKRIFFVFNIFMILTLLVMSGNVQVSQASALINLEGTFIKLWGDGAPSLYWSESAYFIAIPRLGKVRLNVPAELLSDVGGAAAVNRRSVSIQGRWLVAGKIFSVQSLALLKGEMPGPEGIYGPQPWVSILCKFSDYAAEPNDWNYFQGMYSSEYPGLDHYWREQSFDLANLEGSGAFGWYILPQPRSYYVYNDQLDFERAAVDCTAVADADVYYPDYIGINLMFNADLDCCAWGGSWTLFLDGDWHTWRMTWEPPWGYQNIGVISHETGHGFGLPHSYWNPNAVYDNKWDVLSDVWSNGNRGGVDPTYGTMGQHTISYHKDMLGWIDPGQMAVIGTGETRTLTLERLALPQNENFLGARILIDDSPNHFITVEARRLVGYDSWLPPITYGLPGGVVLHEIHVFDGMPARVIDIDQNGNTGDPASMWEPGETYITPTLGIEMSVLAASETGYMINIRNQYTPMGGVEIEGPQVGAVFEPITITASVLPEEVVQPITYTWQASGQLPITNTGALSDSVVFVWEEPGTQAITVTASNAYESKTNHFSLPILVPPAGVEVNGAEKADLAGISIFTATVTPITTTVPITYQWSIDDQVIFTHTSGITDTVSLDWEQPGTHSIGVNASSPVGRKMGGWTIDIYVRVYLPAGYKN